MYDRNLGALKYSYKSYLYQWYLQRVCNMSTYDRPLTGYTHAPRSRREMLTTSSLCYQPPPPASYRARTAGATDRAALLSSNGVSEYIVIILLPHHSTLPSQIRQPHNGRVRYLQISAPICSHWWATDPVKVSGRCRPNSSEKLFLRFRVCSVDLLSSYKSF